MNDRIVVIASYSTDLVLLTLMLLGVFRWKEARLTGGIWWIMYTQVGVLYPLVATMIILQRDSRHRD
jgi:hypothetical protein